MVNIAYDAPVEMSPRDQIEDAERRLFELAENGPLRRRLPALHRRAQHRHRHGGRRLQARRPPVGHRHRPARPRPRRWAACSPPTSSSSPAAPAWARRRSPPTSPSTSPRPIAAEQQPDGTFKTVNGGIVGFFSLEMSSEQLATRIIAEQIRRPLLQDPARRASPRPTSTRSSRRRATCRRCRSIIDQTGGISIAQLAARARRLKRQRGLDVLVIDYIQLLSGSAKQGRQPRAGDHRDHHRPQGARQGAGRADHRAVAALAPGREPRRQAPAALGPARIGLDRAGRRRGACSSSARNTT